MVVLNLKTFLIITKLLLFISIKNIKDCHKKYNYRIPYNYFQFLKIFAFLQTAVCRQRSSFTILTQKQQQFLVMIGMKQDRISYSICIYINFVVYLVLVWCLDRRRGLQQHVRLCCHIWWQVYSVLFLVLNVFACLGLWPTASLLVGIFEL